MNRCGSLVALVSGTVWLAGCASPPNLGNLEPVGPEIPSSTRIGGNGWLQVYSATREYDTGGNTFYYPHTNYVIYDAQGRIVKHVRNHIGVMDQTPAIVTLPAGSYKVLAKHPGYGQVKIPVVVDPSQATLVHLDRAWQPPVGTQESALVRLPDGECIGYRAELNKQPRAETSKSASGAKEAGTPPASR
jgi:hypothetical protein